MFLKEFNSRQLQRESKSVQDEALKRPVVITRQGHEGTVLMSKTEYAKLVKAANQ